MERIKELREAKGLNQQGLALKLNLSQSTISYYETGERKPDLDALLRMSDFFDVSVDFLIGKSNIRKYSIIDDKDADSINFIDMYSKLTLIQKKHVSAFVQGLLADSNDEIG